jgi:hypothetical protein
MGELWTGMLCFRRQCGSVVLMFLDDSCEQRGELFFVFNETTKISSVPPLHVTGAVQPQLLPLLSPGLSSSVFGTL